MNKLNEYHYILSCWIFTQRVKRWTSRIVTEVISKLSWTDNYVINHYDKVNVLTSSDKPVTKTNINDNIEEILQSPSIAFPRHPRDEEEQTPSGHMTFIQRDVASTLIRCYLNVAFLLGNDKTNSIHEATVARTNKNCNRGTAKEERSVEKLLEGDTSPLLLMQPHITFVVSADDFSASSVKHYSEASQWWNIIVNHHDGETSQWNISKSDRHRFHNNILWQ